MRQPTPPPSHHVKARNWLASCSLVCFLALLAIPLDAQMHFRIRADDTQPLNADAGWAAPLDAHVTVEAHRKFRIRFETGPLDPRQRAQVTLQYRKNGGPWRDALAYPDNDPDTAPATPEVWVVTSARYQDGEPASDVLRGSPMPFLPGAGKTAPGPFALPLGPGHTELEFSLVLPTFHDGARQNLSGDIFEFRLASADSPAADVPAKHPRITLRVPPGLIGATFVESPNRVGPFRDRNGNLYAILEPAETDNVFMVIKSADGGRTWQEQDPQNRPRTNDLESVDAVLANDELHIAHHGGKRVVYHVFRVSSHPAHPDTYRVRDEPIAAPITYAEQSVALELAPDGKVHCFYARTVGARGGVYYRTRGATWGPEQSLDQEPGSSFYGVAAVRGTRGGIHAVYASDQGLVYHRSLSADGVLSPPQLLTAEAGLKREDRVPLMPPVSWDQDGQEMLMVGYRKAADGRLYTRVLANGGPAGPEEPASSRPVSNDQAQSRQPTASLANDGPAVYLLYADAASEEIYLNVYTPGSGWGADRLERPGFEADLIRAAVFTHSAKNGGRKVLGYLVDNGSDGYTGTVRYEETPLPLAGIR